MKPLPIASDRRLRLAAALFCLPTLLQFHVHARSYRKTNDQNATTKKSKHGNHHILQPEQLKLLKPVTTMFEKMSLNDEQGFERISKDNFEGGEDSDKDKQPEQSNGGWFAAGLFGGDAPAKKEEKQPDNNVAFNLFGGGAAKQEETKKEEAATDSLTQGLFGVKKETKQEEENKNDDKPPLKRGMSLFGFLGGATDVKKEDVVPEVIDQNDEKEKPIEDEKPKEEDNTQNLVQGFFGGVTKPEEKPQDVVVEETEKEKSKEDDNKNENRQDLVKGLFGGGGNHNPGNSNPEPIEVSENNPIQVESKPEEGEDAKARWKRLQEEMKQKMANEKDEDEPDDEYDREVVTPGVVKPDAVKPNEIVKPDEVQVNLLQENEENDKEKSGENQIIIPEKKEEVDPLVQGFFGGGIKADKDKDKDVVNNDALSEEGPRESEDEEVVENPVVEVEQKADVKSNEVDEKKAITLALFRGQKGNDEDNENKEKKSITEKNKLDKLKTALFGGGSKESVKKPADNPPAPNEEETQDVKIDVEKDIDKEPEVKAKENPLTQALFGRKEEEVHVKNGETEQDPNLQNDKERNLQGNEEIRSEEGDHLKSDEGKKTVGIVKEAEVEKKPDSEEDHMQNLIQGLFGPKPEVENKPQVVESENVKVDDEDQKNEDQENEDDLSWLGVLGPTKPSKPEENKQSQEGPSSAGKDSSGKDSNGSNIRDAIGRALQLVVRNGENQGENQENEQIKVDHDDAQSQTKVDPVVNHSYFYTRGSARDTVEVRFPSRFRNSFSESFRSEDQNQWVKRMTMSIYHLHVEEEVFVPKTAHFNLRIYSHWVAKSLTNRLKTELWIASVLQKLKFETEQGLESGVQWSAAVFPRGLDLSFSGSPSKLAVLVETVGRAMRRFGEYEPSSADKQLIVGGRGKQDGCGSDKDGETEAVKKEKVRTKVCSFCYFPCTCSCVCKTDYIASKDRDSTTTCCGLVTCYTPYADCCATACCMRTDKEHTEYLNLGFFGGGMTPEEWAQYVKEREEHRRYLKLGWFGGGRTQEEWDAYVKQNAEHREWLIQGFFGGGTPEYKEQLRKEEEARQALIRGLFGGREMNETQEEKEKREKAEKRSHQLARALFGNETEEEKAERLAAQEEYRQDLIDGFFGSGSKSKKSGSKGAEKSDGERGGERGDGENHEQKEEEKKEEPRMTPEELSVLYKSAFDSVIGSYFRKIVESGAAVEVQADLWARVFETFGGPKSSRISGVKTLQEELATLLKLRLQKESGESKSKSGGEIVKSKSEGGDDHDDAKPAELMQMAPRPETDLRKGQEPHELIIDIDHRKNANAAAHSLTIDDMEGFFGEVYANVFEAEESIVVDGLSMGNVEATETEHLMELFFGEVMSAKLQREKRGRSGEKNEGMMIVKGEIESENGSKKDGKSGRKNIIIAKKSSVSASGEENVAGQVPLAASFRLRGASCASNLKKKSKDDNQIPNRILIRVPNTATSLGPEESDKKKESADKKQGSGDKKKGAQEENNDTSEPSGSSTLIKMHIALVTGLTAYDSYTFSVQLLLLKRVLDQTVVKNMQTSIEKRASQQKEEDAEVKKLNPKETNAKEAEQLEKKASDHNDIDLKQAFEDVKKESKTSSVFPNFRFSTQIWDESAEHPEGHLSFGWVLSDSSGAVDSKLLTEYLEEFLSHVDRFLSDFLQAKRKEEKETTKEDLHKLQEEKHAKFSSFFSSEKKSSSDKNGSERDGGYKNRKRFPPSWTLPSHSDFQETFARIRKELVIELVKKPINVLYEFKRFWPGVAGRLLPMQIADNSRSNSRRSSIASRPSGKRQSKAIVSASNDKFQRTNTLGTDLTTFGIDHETNAFTSRFVAADFLKKDHYSVLHFVQFAAQISLRKQPSITIELAPEHILKAETEARAGRKKGTSSSGNCLSSCFSKLFCCSGQRSKAKNTMKKEATDFTVPPVPDSNILFGLAGIQSWHKQSAGRCGEWVSATGGNKKETVPGQARVLQKVSLRKTVGNSAKEKPDSLTQFNKLVAEASEMRKNSQEGTGVMDQRGENGQNALLQALGGLKLSADQIKISQGGVEMKQVKISAETKVNAIYQGQRGRSLYAQEGLVKSKFLQSMKGDQTSGVDNDCSASEVVSEE